MLDKVISAPSSLPSFKGTSNGSISHQEIPDFPGTSQGRPHVSHHCPNQDLGNELYLDSASGYDCNRLRTEENDFIRNKKAVDRVRVRVKRKLDHDRIRRLDRDEAREPDHHETRRLDRDRVRLDRGEARELNRDRVRSGEARELDHNVARRLDHHEARRLDRDRVRRLDCDKAQELDHNEAVDQDEAWKLNHNRGSELELDRAGRLDHHEARRLVGVCSEGPDVLMQDMLKRLQLLEERQHYRALSESVVRETLFI